MFGRKLNVGQPRRFGVSRGRVQRTERQLETFLGATHRQKIRNLPDIGLQCRCDGQEIKIPLNIIKANEHQKDLQPLPSTLWTHKDDHDQLREKSQFEAKRKRKKRERHKGNLLQNMIQNQVNQIATRLSFKYIFVFFTLEDGKYLGRTVNN